MARRSGLLPLHLRLLLLLVVLLLFVVSALIAVFLLRHRPSPDVLGEFTPEDTFVKKTIAQHKIVIFSKSYCPYCKQAKAVFKDLNEKPFVVELDLQEDGHDIQKAVMKLVGRRTVPQVFIHSQHLGGADDTLEAYRSGKLAVLLAKKGIPG